MKVIIAGSREYTNYNELRELCDKALSLSKDIEIVSGRCRGTDKLGERYAEEKGYKMTPFPANWKAYDKAAGHIRNEQMAKYADALIAFWDGSSNGTKDMIDLAKKYNLKIKIYKIVLK